MRRAPTRRPPVEGQEEYMRVLAALAIVVVMALMGEIKPVSAA